MFRTKVVEKNEVQFHRKSFLLPVFIHSTCYSTLKMEAVGPPET
jgi:hypothetical protein